MEKKPSLDSKIKDAAMRKDRLQNFTKSVFRAVDGQMDLSGQQRPNLKVIQGGAER